MEAPSSATKRSSQLTREMFSIAPPNPGSANWKYLGKGKGLPTRSWSHSSVGRVSPTATGTANSDTHSAGRLPAIPRNLVATPSDDPADVAHDRFARALWGDHTLALPVLGTRESITGMSRDVIEGYWDRRYHPSTVVLAAAGHVVVAGEYFRVVG